MTPKTRKVINLIIANLLTVLDFVIKPVFPVLNKHSKFYGARLL